MRVSGKQLGAGADSVSKAAERLDQIASARGSASNATLLSSLLESRLEEAQELQQLVSCSVNRPCRHSKGSDDWLSFTAPSWVRNNELIGPLSRRVEIYPAREFVYVRWDVNPELVENGSARKSDAIPFSLLQ